MQVVVDRHENSFEVFSKTGGGNEVDNLRKVLDYDIGEVP